MPENRFDWDNPLPYKIIVFAYGLIVWILSTILYRPFSPIAILGFILMVIGGILLVPYVYYIVFAKEEECQRLQ